MSIVLDGTSGLTSPAAVLTTTPLAVTSGGTGAATLVLPALKQQIFATAGASTFTVPTGVTQLKVTVIGGGGGGGLSGRATGGGASVKWITGLVPAAIIATTVGAGGAAVNATPYIGATGGSSSFGAYCSATGGLGIGQGGLGSGGDLNAAGGIGSFGATCGTGNYSFASGGSLFSGGTTNATIGVYGVGGSGTGNITGNVAGAAGVILVEWIA